MNWFTNKVIAGNSTKYKAEKASDDACCEHVEADPSVAFMQHMEQDSFGMVASYVCCEACNQEFEDYEDNIEHTCYDCKSKFKAKDGIAWKWYDFYAPQGDDPLYICNTCRTKPKHLERVRKDRADYEEEFGISNNSDDYDY